MQHLGARTTRGDAGFQLSQSRRVVPLAQVHFGQVSVGARALAPAVGALALEFGEQGQRRIEAGACFGEGAALDRN